jgi:formylglycine-generating enzyme required for sulfatase activity
VSTYGAKADTGPISQNVWPENPGRLRSAHRLKLTTDDRYFLLGFRVGRTLSAGAGAIRVAPGVR